MRKVDQIIEECIGNEAPYCQARCPLHVDVKGYVNMVKQGRYQEALTIIKSRLLFPGIMGRICARPCEEACKRAEIDEAVAIAYLKRAAKEYGEAIDEFACGDESGKRVAVIGGGPAGVTAAHDLRKMGHAVTLFEAEGSLGGMLAAAIPDFRLPKAIVEEEFSIMERCGVKINLNAHVGKELSFASIEKDFDAVIMATGAPLSKKLSFEGIDQTGVLWGLDFLRDVKTGKRTELKGRTVVIGGGNVAIDVALTALRLGAHPVSVVCLESREEMPAFEAEVEDAVACGIDLQHCWGPMRIIGEGPCVTGIDLVRCASVFDKKGRFAPTFDETAGKFLQADVIILAVGQETDLTCLEGSGIEVTEKGLLTCHYPDFRVRTDKAVFGCGDVVTGPKSVVDAIASAQNVALSVGRYLRAGSVGDGDRTEGGLSSRLVVSLPPVPPMGRVAMPTRGAEERCRDFGEVSRGFSREEATKEAERCLQCECKVCVRECELLHRLGETPRDLAAKLKAGYFKEDSLAPYLCSVCDLCKRVCPNELSLGEMFMEVREEMVASGIGPLKQHQFVRRDQKWSASDSVILAQPDPRTGRCERAFFPGCGLSGYSPELAMSTYKYLVDRLPDTGIITGCCGGPTYFLGDRTLFQEMLNRIVVDMKKLGATELIVACPDCYHTIKHHAPDIRLRAVVDIFLEHGLPPLARHASRKIVTVHDSCKARWEKGWQESARQLIGELGCEIEEMAHSRDMTLCCGMGGMVPYADNELAQTLIKRRADEASYDIVTYCASCREALASVKPAAHILDLIFSDDRARSFREPPKSGKERRDNQARFKTMIEEYIIGRTRTEQQENA